MKFSFATGRSTSGNSDRELSRRSSRNALIVSEVIPSTIRFPVYSLSKLSTLSVV